MTNPALSRPAPDEHAPHHAHYIAAVAGDDVMDFLREQAVEFEVVVGRLDEAAAGYRYAPGKWSVRQVVGHLSDAERIFAMRALCLARGERAALPNFDEDAYAAAAGHDDLPIAALLRGLGQVRQSTLTLLRQLPTAAWLNRGTVNNVQLTVRAIAFITAGHAAHHLDVLRARYGLTGTEVRLRTLEP